jgi:hypothetical protein
MFDIKPSIKVVYTPHQYNLLKHSENHLKKVPRAPKMTWSPWASNPKAFSKGAKYLHGIC